MFNDIIASFQNAPQGLIERYSALKVPDSILMQASATGYDLLIYDCIGMGCVEADDIVQALAIAAGAPVRVRINSLGGDAFEGFAIYNVLSSYSGEVNVLIDGLAASAAAYVAMAGDTVEMQPASFLMIHNGWTVSVGDRNRLQTAIQALSKIDAAQTSLFAAKTGLTSEEIGAMLDTETWFSADEAVAIKLADNIIDPEALAMQPMLPSDPDNDENDGQPDDNDGDEPMPKMQSDAMEQAYARAAVAATCATNGHVWGSLDKCLMCGVDKLNSMFAFEKRRRLLQSRLLSLPH